MDNMTGRSILVSGRVQGVFYRASTVDEAKKLGLTGWAKNLATGQVLIEVFGSLGKIESLMAWCAQGPPMAKVSNVEVLEIPFRDESDFKVVY